MNWQDVSVRKRAPFPKVGDYVDFVIQDIAENQKGNGLALIQALWTDIVGERISSVSRPVSFEKGDLALKIRSSVWRQELHSQMSHIINAIHDKLPDIAVENIIFR